MFIIQTCFIIVYSAYRQFVYGRPYFTTCIFLIGGAMFWVSGYLLLFPPNNVFSKLSKSSYGMMYPASNILPYQTIVHIGLFMLGSLSYWKARNLLGFCMSKMGCFYLIWHSGAHLFLSIYHFYVHGWQQHYVHTFAIVFNLWFLVPAIIGYYYTTKEKVESHQISFHYKYPIISINYLFFERQDIEMKSKKTAHKNKARYLKAVQKSSELNFVSNRKLEHESDSDDNDDGDDDNLDNNDNDESIEMQPLKSNVSRWEEDESKDAECDRGRRGKEMKRNKEEEEEEEECLVDKQQQYWCTIIYICVFAEMLWFILYMLLVLIHHWTALRNSFEGHALQFTPQHGVAFGESRVFFFLWDDVASGCDWKPNMPLSEWFSGTTFFFFFATYTYVYVCIQRMKKKGYVVSFTMVFHRAFLTCVVYNIIYDCNYINVLYIAFGSTLMCLGLNASYLLYIVVNMESKGFPLMSALLMSLEMCIEVATLYATYQLVRLCPPPPRLKHIEQLRPRLSTFQFAEWTCHWPRSLSWCVNAHATGNGDPRQGHVFVVTNGITEQGKRGAYFISLGSVLLLASMLVETMLLCSVYIWHISRNEDMVMDWNILNDLVLWGLHACAIFVYMTIQSAQFPDSYARTCALGERIQLAGMLFSLLQMYYVVRHDTNRTHRHWTTWDLMAVVFCGLKFFWYAMVWFGFGRLQDIRPFRVSTVPHQLETEAMLKTRNKCLYYIVAYAALLFFYMVACLLQSEWNGDLISLNMISPSHSTFRFYTHICIRVYVL
ncbi:hypothetical protein RFI_01509 [Reticulomyxa filosa]|uniref:Uncharacterized protein n=1 Tax=Reticulomyxa filosa TaxID=46433 RepID=X6PBJ1_RETFI|nr:hypothetical protein RFI_01509 [Reticulomyxa filosa]|eukprot:ETO35556.1 hypothetical protein RFI_01509 [Reticulomyxa filosa]